MADSLDERDDHGEHAQHQWTKHCQTTAMSRQSMAPSSCLSRRFYDLRFEVGCAAIVVDKIAVRIENIPPIVGAAADETCCCRRAVLGLHCDQWGRSAAAG